jgi:formylglycine-generating enzyme required for sulfatase activity
MSPDSIEIKFDVFIAYSRRDGDQAKQLYDLLSDFCHVFLDEYSIPTGAKWDVFIPAALSRSSVVAILVGQDLEYSHFLNSEIQRAIDSSRKENSSQRIVPICLVQNTTNLPYGLERYQGIDAAKKGMEGVFKEILRMLLDLRISNVAKIDRPAYPNEETRIIANQLKAATDRYQKLVSSKVANVRVLETLQAEISSLKYQLRTGGSLRPGDILANNFLILDRLGSGGFSHVWLGLEELSQQKVAVKVLRGDLMGDLLAVDRFKQGARAMESLEHDNICKIVCCDGLKSVLNGGNAKDTEFVYFVMEYLAEGDLKANVLAKRIFGDQLFYVIDQVCEALSFAHARSIVHRDIKPENILLSDSGVAKITDFDLAIVDSRSMKSQTRGIGSYIFAPPEQLSNSKLADHRSDIYSLGMTTLFVLYGDLLPLDVIRSPGHFLEQLDVSRHVREVIRRSIAWKMEDRHQSVAEFQQELRAAWHAAPSAAPALRVEVIPNIDIEIVHVPAGSFQMGDDANPETSPVHVVHLSDFWISRFPITNQQYEKFRQANNHEPPAFHNDPNLTAPTQPVIGVSQADAVAFCNWVSGNFLVSRDGKPATVRLPSESEWEYAARGPMNRIYPWGFAAPSLQLANYGNNIGRTTSVGNYPAGASWLSLQDMAGNVWEWCQDNWHDSYAAAPLDGSAWLTAEPGTSVVRGGSFLFGEEGLTTYYRYWWPAAKRNGNQGFRIVVDCYKSQDRD